MSINVGTRFPAYATSMGRVLLAGLPEEALDAYLRRVDLRPLTAADDHRPGRAAARAREARDQGWALVDQELEEGLRSVAAPIRDRSGETVAAMNLSAHASRMTIDAARRTLVPPLLADRRAHRGRPAGGRHRSPAVGRRMTTTTDPPARPAPGGEPRRAVTGVAIAIVLLALNLRTLVAGLPPLLEDIRHDLALSGLVGGLLTTLPVLGFGAFAPLAPRLSRRVPVERLLVACALLTAVAAALRGAGGVAPLLLGCALAGFAVAIAQALLPVFIRARHPSATGVLTGAYSMSLTLGAALAAALAVPLEEWLGSWEASLAAWAVPALVAAAVWTPMAVRSRSPVGGESAPGLWSNRLAWAVSLFMGVQSMAFYAGLSWIPTILEDNGYSAGTAGALQALAALVQLTPAFAVPVLAARAANQVGLLWWIVLLQLAGVLGLLLAIDVAWLWIIVLGIGQGGALGLGLILPVLRGGGAASVAALTAMSLCVGYIVAAAGPWLLGAVHDAFGGWTVALIVFAAICLLELAPGLPATRARTIEGSV